MNPKALVSALAALTICHSLTAGDSRSFEFIKTNSGKVYTHCRVFKTDPDGVIISHELGGAKVLFSDLAPDARAMLGYDEKKEADYVKGRADAAAKEREQFWAYRKEVAKAQASASAAEARRLEVINLQMGGYPAYYGGLTTAGWWDGGYGYSNGYGNGYGYGYSNRGYRDGYLGNRGVLGYHPFYQKGRYTFPTPANAGSLNVIGRNFMPPQIRTQAAPMGVPAMGSPPPALGAGIR